MLSILITNIFNVTKQFNYIFLIIFKKYWALDCSKL